MKKSKSYYSRSAVYRSRAIDEFFNSRNDNNSYADIYEAYRESNLKNAYRIAKKIGRLKRKYGVDNLYGHLRIYSEEI